MQVWLGLGSNLEQPLLQLKQALQRLEMQEGISLLEVSSFYRTPPWGDEQQDDFINAVARVETRLRPLALLGVLQSIENDMGRQRTARRWGPRLIDIDLLLYGDWTRQTEELTIPHPHMHERAFVLLPLSELDIDLEVPGRGTVATLLQRLEYNGIERLSGGLNLQDQDSWSGKEPA